MQTQTIPHEWQSTLDELMPTIEKHGRRLTALDLGALRLECALSDGSILRITSRKTRVLAFLLTPHHIPCAPYRKQWGYRIHHEKQLERYLVHIDRVHDPEEDADTLSISSDARSSAEETEPQP